MLYGIAYSYLKYNIQLCVYLVCTYNVPLWVYMWAAYIICMYIANLFTCVYAIVVVAIK